MRARMSAKLMPAARTRMRICPSPGTGSADSRISNTSAAPWRGITACRIGAAYHAPGCVGGFVNRLSADDGAGRLGSRVGAVLEPPLRREQREQRLLRVHPV